MRTREKKNVMIGVLCSLLVFMGIGYAVLSQVLTINAGGKIKGNWNIYIESIEPYYVAGHAKSLESKIGIDKLSASIEAELNQPNDYVDYKVTVRNGGNINAQLTSATLVSKKTNEYIEITSTAITGTVLNADKTMEFIVTVKFKDVNSFEKQDETMNAITELQLNFVQIETTSISENGSVTPEQSGQKFTINNDGLITSYNYNYGTEVKVPAEVNGIAVKTIDDNSFVRANVQIGSAENKSNGETKNFAVITDLKNSEAINNILFEYACVNMEQNSTSDSTGEITGNCVGKTSLSEIGITVFNSINDAESFYGDYDIFYEPKYADITKGILEEPLSLITKLDLSEAINLESIEEYSFDEEDLGGGYVSGRDCDINCGLGALQSVILPENGKLTTIGRGAFTANKLTTIKIPDTVTLIGVDAFAGNKLTSAILSSGMISIPSGLFWNNKITSITIPNAITSINSDAFRNNELTNVTIPENVANIYSNAFYNNPLTNVVINYNGTNALTRFNSEWSNIGFGSVTAPTQ